MTEVTSIVDNLSTVLSYYIPGALGLSAFLFLASLKVSSGTHTLYSVMLSFFVKSLVDAINPMLGIRGYPYQWFYIMYVTVALILGVVVCLVFKSKFFRRILNKGFHKNPYEDIWKNVISYKDGCILNIYFDHERKNSVIGQLSNHEENGSDSWFALTNYSVITGDEVIYSSETSEYKPYVIVRPSDAAYIEIITTTPEALDSVSTDE